MVKGKTKLGKLQGIGAKVEGEENLEN